MKTKNIYEIIAILIFIIFILFFGYTVLNYKNLENEISKSIENYGIISIFFFTFLTDLIPQYIAPHFLIASSNILGFNLFYVMISVILGSTFGSIVGFEIARKIRDAKFITNLFGKKKVEKIKESINKKGKYIISLAAISPFPYIPLVIGMLHMKRKNFIIYGILPRIIGLIIIGLINYGFFI